MTVSTSAVAADVRSGVVNHSVSGCGEPITLHTPSNPATALSPSDVGLPSSAGRLVAEAVAHHATWLSNITCVAHSRPGQEQGARSIQYTQNWSGYVANTSSPNYVQGFWAVPSVILPLGQSNAYSSTWPGLGGTSSTSQLIQDGTDDDVSSSGQTHYFWFELVPQEGQQEVTNLTPSAGDSVATSASWSNGTATFGLCDYTKAQCVSGSQSSPAPGASAEWIVERTQINGSFPALADFQTVTFTNAGFDLTPNGQLAYTPATGGAGPYDMETNSGHVLSTPGALSSSGDSFVVTWHAAI